MGRPRMALGSRERDVQDRASMIDSFFHFCTAQELRVMQTVCDYSADTHCLTEDDIVAGYRTLRLGTYFNGLDKQDGLIHIEVRGSEIAPIRLNWLASSLSGPSSLQRHLANEASAVARSERSEHIDI